MVTPGCKHFNLNLLKDLKQLQLHLHGLRKTTSRKVTNINSLVTRNRYTTTSSVAALL